MVEIKLLAKDIAGAACHVWLTLAIVVANVVELVAAQVDLTGQQWLGGVEGGQEVLKILHDNVSVIIRLNHHTYSMTHHG